MICTARETIGDTLFEFELDFTPSRAATTNCSHDRSEPSEPPTMEILDCWIVVRNHYGTEVLTPAFELYHLLPATIRNSIETNILEALDEH